MDKNLTVDKIFKLATTNQLNNNLKEASKSYNEILIIDPNHVMSLSNLGLIFQVLGDNKKAKDYFEKAIKISPTFIDAHFNLGNSLNSLGEMQNSINSFNKVLELNPKHVNANNNLGILSKLKNEFGKAKLFFEKAFEIDPNNADISNNLGSVYFSMGNNQKAFDFFKKTILLNPNHKEGNNNLGLAHLQLGDLDKARTYFEKAIEIDSTLRNPYNNLGTLYQALGNIEMAISFYKKAIKIDKNFEDAIYNLGIIFYENARYDEAIEQFRSINYKKSKSHILTCLYKLDKQSAFFQELENLKNTDEFNAMVGSLCDRARIRYGIKKSNPFCNNSLKYVLKEDLIKKYDFNNIFVKPIKKFINNNLAADRNQTLLTNGNQTSGNLFARKDNFIKEINDVITAEVENYRLNFNNLEEGFIKKWPDNYSIYGWLVNMKSGGKISPHIHENGWLSGSVYINVPPKLETNSGNLVVCYDEKEDIINQDSENKKTINVVTGSLCLFPASLFHYTIPFVSDEDRIVLAFDIVPLS